MSLNTEDVAYLVALVEKAPSTYPRRVQIIGELQAAWRASSQCEQPYRVPIRPTSIMSIGVIEFDASPEAS